MKNKIKNTILFLAVFSLVFSACKDDIEPVIEQLNFERVFSPIDLTARIRNLTTVELSWTVSDNVDHYVVEFSEDSLLFNSIVKTVEVAPDEVPFSQLLDGETQYSARIKGVSAEGLEDSKWSAIAFKTDPENIFYALADGDVKATTAVLKWPAGSEVTHFLIMPGNIERTITTEEKAAGEAEITGLTGETSYTVTLYKNTKHRGEIEFTTLIDLGGATAVYPEDDLDAVISALEDGGELVLFPGDYTVYTGTITLNKSISLKGLYPYDKPVIHVQFVLEDGVQNVTIKDLEMDGTYLDATEVEVVTDHAFQYNTSGVDYGSLEVIDCVIHDYNKSIFTGSSSIVSTIASISMDNCVVTNVLTNSADCIDFRGGYVASLSLTNSTFVNCAPARDFVRLDDSSGAFPGKVSNVLIDHCTLYGVSNNASRRILYVRFVENTLTVKNTIIVATVGYYTNQDKSSQPDCSNNNYFNAAGFVSGGSEVSGAKFDLSGNFTTLDPGFVNAENGDFTVTNQTLIDNNVGDPRW